MSFLNQGKWGSGTLLWIFPPPTGSSVNDGINPEEFNTLHYNTVDQVIQLVFQFIARALMAKFHVKAAYILLCSGTSFRSLSAQYEMAQPLLC